MITISARRPVRDVWLSILCEVFIGKESGIGSADMGCTDCL